MKIGVWIPRRYLTSVRIYSDHVCADLERSGVGIIPFRETDPIPDADIIWDPTCTSARFPNRKLLRDDKPWVVTVHGASNLSLPLSYTFPAYRERLRGLYINAKRRLAWQLYRRRVAHIITVSEFAKQELVRELHFRPSDISVIYHGFDRALFYPEPAGEPYLLHVSVYQPKKNVDRILEAYAGIPEESRMPFTVVCPGYPREVRMEKLTLIREAVDRDRVGQLMRGAYAFIFPSIHESFGLPLVEAMACGVPVVSSDTTACPEIVQGAGLLVDPFSTESLREAMVRISKDTALRERLSREALVRAADFSWEKTAAQHLAVFRSFIFNK